MTQQEEFQKWLEAAIATLSTSEQTETFSNLEAMLGSKAYTQLTASQSDGGYPSPTAFMGLMPDLRMRRLSMLGRQASELEDAMVDFIRNLGEENPEYAAALADGLMRGNVSAELRAELLELKSEWHKSYAELPHPEPAPAERDLLRTGGHQIVPQKDEPMPHPPQNRNARKNPKDAIARATQSFDAGNGGDADAGP